MSSSGVAPVEIAFESFDILPSSPSQLSLSVTLRARGGGHVRTPYVH